MKSSRNATFAKRLSDQGEADAKLHKKELKFQKASKNFEEGIKNASIKSRLRRSNGSQRLRCTSMHFKQSKTRVKTARKILELLISS